MNDAEVFESASKQFERTAAFMGRIDSRVPVILGAELGMAAVLALNLPKPAVVFAWYSAIPLVCYLTLACACFWQLYRCTYPTLDGGHNSLIYFREVAKLTESDFIAKFSAQSQADHNRDLLQQVWKVSEIANAKYNDLKIAMQCLGVSIVFWIAVLAVFVAENRVLVSK